MSVAVRILRAAGRWLAWSLRLFVLGIVGSAFGSWMDSAGGWFLVWVTLVSYAAFSHPVRPAAAAGLTALRYRVPFGEARAARLVRQEWSRVWFTAGVAQEPDEDEQVQERPFRVLLGYWLWVAGLSARPRREYRDVPVLLHMRPEPGQIVVQLRSGARGKDSQDLVEPSVVRHVQEPIRMLVGDLVTVRAVVGASSVRMYIRFVDPLAGSRDSVEPAPGMPLRIGVDETGENVMWDPFEATHTAVQGMTRSGKSVQEYTRLSGLAGRGDLQVSGLDPSGVLLGPWVGRSRWVATPATAGDVEVYEHFHDVIAQVVAEMDQRNMRLAAWGKDKLDAADFSAELPVLVVVLEEWPGIQRAAKAEDTAQGRKPAERVAGKIDAAVGRLVAEGAKVGVRVVLLGQRLSANSLDTDSRSNFGVRHTMRVDNADAVGMLHDNASEWAPIVAQFPPGQGLIERPGLGQRRYRADYTSYETYLSRVRGKVATHV